MKTKIKFSNGEEMIVDLDPTDFLNEVTDDSGRFTSHAFVLPNGVVINPIQIIKVEKH